MKLGPGTRVYVTGCGGMLGDALYPQLQALGASVRATDIKVGAAWLHYADVRNALDIRRDIVGFEPDLIINLAALTDLELCEDEPDNAWATNAFGARSIGCIANELDVPCVHVSTAGVFCGNEPSYGESDRPRPVSAYARSKFYADCYMLEKVRQSLVIRAGWMMGGGPHKDKKFINKLYRQIAAGATQLFVVGDRFGTPTYTNDFAAGLLALLERDCYGLFHQACPGAVGRYELACTFVSLLGLENRVAVTSVASNHFDSDYFAPRPASECLRNDRLNALGLNQMRHWRECLEEYAEGFREDYIDPGQMGGALAKNAG